MKISADNVTNVRDDGVQTGTGYDDRAVPNVNISDTPQSLIAPDTSGVNDAPTVTIAAPGTTYTRVGTEFLVNTQTTGDQKTAAITNLVNGGFVVTWSTSDTAQDGSGTSIKAQIYTAAGAKVGGEFLVNSQTASNQTVPVVTNLTNGGFVVAWATADAAQDGSGGSVKAQVFTAAGAKSGGEFQVNTSTTSGQYDPSITGLANGGFVVTWSDGSGTLGDSSLTSIKAQVFSAAGAKVGSEFLVNTQTTLAQEFSTVTSLANGGFVATWRDQSGTLGDASGYSIKAQVFSAAGAKVGGEFLVNTQTANSQFQPAIAGLANGGFVATWYDQSGTLGDAAGYSVKAQIYTAAGVKVGGEFLVNTTTAGDQSDPTVTGLANGSFVVTWNSSDPAQDGSGYSIKAQVYAATGDKIGGEFLVNTGALSDQTLPVVAALANGGFAVTWQDLSGTLGDSYGSYSIKAQLYGPTGGVFTATEQVAQNLKGAITIGDADAGTSALTVNVITNYGALTLAAGTSGATIVSGNGTNSVVVSGTIAQLNALFVTDLTSAISYTANTDAPPASVTINVFANDGGNTGTGGALNGYGTFDIAITPVNDAPTIANLQGDVAVQTEDVYTNSYLDVGQNAVITDPDSGNFDGGRLVVAVTSGFDGDSIGIYQNGNVAIDGNGTVTVGGVAIGTASGGYFVYPYSATFTIDLNANATAALTQTLLHQLFVLNQQIEPSGGTREIDITLSDGDGGSSTYHTQLVVNAINDEPFGTDATLTTVANTPYVIQTGDFGFDPGGATLGGFHYPENDHLRAVIITTLPTAGTLTLNGVAVTAGAAVAASEIAAGHLVFTAAPGGSGAGYASFTFQVQDDGGTANGGIDTDQTPNTLTFNVPSPNHAPVVDLNTGTAGVNDTNIFIEGSGNAGIGTDIAVTDADGDTIAGATVTITDPIAGDALFANLPLGNGITLDPSSTATTLILVGTASGAAYAQALAQIGYTSTSDDPTLGGTDTARSITVTVNDGTTDSAPATLALQVVGQNDAPVLGRSGNTVGYTENGPGVTVNADITVSDVDSANLSSATVTIGAGRVAGDTLAFVDQHGIAGSFNGSTGVLTLSGSATLADYQAALRSVSFSSTSDDPTAAARTISFVVNDGAGDHNLSAAATSTVEVTPIDDKPTLTGFGPSVTFTESAVNGAPQLLDIDVTLTNAEANFAGQTLTLTGGLAEDTIAIRDQGIAAGQIGVSGGNVTFGGAVIGTVSGGNGTTALSVALNANATSAAVEALIENLTYANASDTPTASHTFTLNITDGGGFAGFGTFNQLTGAANPFDGIDVGVLSAPAFIDLDGDGDLDLVVGEQVSVQVYRNDGVGQPFTHLTGSANPFDGIAFGADVSPAFVDLDGDGDLDGVFGNYDGQLIAVRNNGAGTAFTPMSGAANPFNGIYFGINASAAFIDFDGDGDLDLVTSSTDTGLRAFRNNGNGVAVTELTGADNPFAGITVSGNGKIAAVDFDLDGDRDLVLAAGNAGPIEAYRNNGVGQAFTALTGAANPFNGISGPANGTIAFNDFDRDGDTDVVLGMNDGTLSAFRNDTNVGRSITVNVTAQNDAPSGTDRTLTVVEDTAVTLSASKFGFGDVEGNTLQAVRITTLPTAGTLTLNGIAVTAGSFVAVGEIAAGHLVYTPGANGNGAGYASLTFQVQDNGGTANGGVDTDPSPNTLTFNVIAVNDAPSGADRTIAAIEDTPFALTAGKFGFSDVDGNVLQAVEITTLPTAGTLTLNGVAVTAGTLVAVSEIAAGHLVYTPGANGNGAGYASFSFQVQDNGGTANGGIDIDQSPNTLTIDVLAVNDAPSGTDRTLTVAQGMSATLTTGKFGFSDVDGHALQAVEITTLPTAGTLTLNGSPVAAGTFVAASEIAAGHLIYTPAANGSGAGYASFAFQVQDNGGTAFGGVDTDQSPNTITFNVAATTAASAVGTQPANGAGQDIGPALYAKDIVSGGDMHDWSTFAGVSDMAGGHHFPGYVEQVDKLVLPGVDSDIAGNGHLLPSAEAGWTHAGPAIAHEQVTDLGFGHVASLHHFVAGGDLLL